MRGRNRRERGFGRRGHRSGARGRCRVREGVSRTGFSLSGFDADSQTPGRLKPALLNRMPNLKQSALQIFHETLAAIDIPSAMRRKLGRAGSRIFVNYASIDLAAFERICTVAIGKASVAIARGLAESLSPDFRANGIVVAPTAASALPEGFHLIVAGHPVPDKGSFAAGRAILDLLAAANQQTLVFFLLSGGGSALVELPLNPGVTLEDMQELNRVLVTCGASIDEINAVRKHLSAVKGGRLAVAAGGAMIITLGVTDVPEGQESALASGPTLPDPRTDK